MHEELTFSISIKLQNYTREGYGVISIKSVGDGIYKPAPVGFFYKSLTLRLYNALYKKF